MATLPHSVEFLIRHGYAILFCAVLAEQGAIPIPTVPLLLAYGALARVGNLNLALALLSGLCGCLIADNLWYKLGRSKGGRILRLICRVSLEPDSCVRQTENVFLKYGMRSLLISKFIPGLNAVAAPMAGSSGVPWRTFAAYDTAGASIWLAAYLGLGYVFADQLEIVGGYALHMGSWLFATVAAFVALWLAWKYVQRREFIRKLALARISPEQLQEMLDSDEDVMIVDLRTRVQLDQDFIPGALRMPVEELVERSGEIPRDRDIVLVCS